MGRGKYLLHLAWALKKVLKGVSVNINTVRPFTAGSFSRNARFQ